MKVFKWISAVMVLGVLTAGCAHKKPLFPVHDEVLIYELPYDLTYLRVLDALQTVPNWNLEITDKENGLIRVRNTNYSGFDNSEERLVDFMVTRLEAGETSIEIHKDSQQVLGCGDLMKAVARELSQEVKL